MLSTALTLAFVVGEAIAGYLSHSLALLSGAGHNFADALSLILSAYAVWIAHKPSTPRRTFGYHRAGILVALVNAVALVVIALLIFWEAFDRFRHPEPVHGGPMIVVALVAVLMNTAIALWLRGDAKNDLNMRSAYLHMAGDAVSAIGVVLAGVVVWFTGATQADPIVSILIGGFILYSSWGILTESVNVLMEAAPEGLDMMLCEKAFRSVPGVRSVHDLHVWTVGSQRVACCCHVVVSEQSIRQGEQVLRAVTEMLDHEFNITHTTIQIEVEGCPSNDMYCHMHPSEEDHSDHDQTDGE